MNIPTNILIKNTMASILPFATAHALVPGQNPPVIKPTPIIIPPTIAEPMNIGFT
jgi:hypothetical protein